MCTAHYSHCTFFTCSLFPPSSLFFFFNDTATTEIYTLSLHDALPICLRDRLPPSPSPCAYCLSVYPSTRLPVYPSTRLSVYQDRKSTRLNSSHLVISYAVFCLKKKKKQNPLVTTEPYRLRPRADATYP